jgi:hypothetical protein
MNAEQRLPSWDSACRSYPRAIANYVRFKKAGHFIYLSGHPPSDNLKLIRFVLFPYQFAT